MDLCLQGMDYFYRYDEFQLKMFITLAYIGWAGILAVLVIQERVTTSKKKTGRQFQLIDQIVFVLSVFIFIVLTGIFNSIPFMFRV
jgi:hypothetical protein